MFVALSDTGRGLANLKGSFRCGWGGSLEPGSANPVFDFVERGGLGLDLGLEFLDFGLEVADLAGEFLVAAAVSVAEDHDDQGNEDECAATE